MGYDAVRAGVVNLIQGCGLAESKEIDFVNASQHEYGNTFILEAEKGENAGPVLIDHLYDFQEWKIRIAFDRTKANQTVTRDEMHRLRETILKKFDDSDNWSSFAEIIKWLGWNVEKLPNYFVLHISLNIKDKLTY